MSNQNQQLGAKLTEAFGKGEKMFKSMIGAIPGIGMFGDLLLSMADATGILEPFQAVLDIILGLFGVMGAQIIPVLMTALIPLIQLFKELQPIFVLVGKVLGVLLQVGLIPFIALLELLMKVIKPFLPLFTALIPLIEAFSPLIKLVSDLLSVFISFIPITQTTTALIKILTDWIKAAGDAVKAVTDVGSNIVSGVASFFGFQEGTHSVPSTGVYKLHAGEEVKPSAYSGITESLLEEQNEKLDILIRLQSNNSNLPIRRVY